MSEHILQRWMDLHQTTVHQLAEAAGCSVPHIRNIMAGRKEASLSLAKRLSDVTGGVVHMDAFIRPGSNEELTV